MAILQDNINDATTNIRLMLEHGATRGVLGQCVAEAKVIREAMEAETRRNPNASQSHEAQWQAIEMEMQDGLKALETIVAKNQPPTFQLFDQASWIHSGLKNFAETLVRTKLPRGVTVRSSGVARDAIVREYESHCEASVDKVKEQLIREEIKPVLKKWWLDYGCRMSDRTFLSVVESIIGQPARVRLQQIINEPVNQLYIHGDDQKLYATPPNSPIMGMRDMMSFIEQNLGWSGQYPTHTSMVAQAIRAYDHHVAPHIQHLADCKPYAHFHKGFAVRGI